MRIFPYRRQSTFLTGLVTYTDPSVLHSQTSSTPRIPNLFERQRRLRLPTHSGFFICDFHDSSAMSGDPRNIQIT